MQVSGQEARAQQKLLDLDPEMLTLAKQQLANEGYTWADLSALERLRYSLFSSLSLSLSLTHTYIHMRVHRI